MHDIYDEMTPAKAHDTPQRLKTDPFLQKHFRWVAKQKVKPPSYG